MRVNASNSAAFPIHEILPALLATLASRSRAVLEAPPGAGKTTQVPLALLDQPWLAGRKILLLEPRRIAARAAAEFMARQLGEEVGETVGYRIRFEAKVSPATRIEVVTEGILTRLLQSDPELGGVGAILFDEFHERHLHGDLGAALALDVQGTLRPDLRLLVMSATLDGERIARWLDAPRLTSAGRSFPVEIAYPPARSGEDWLPHLRRVAEQALADTDGDILVFLPGKREIERARALLNGIAPTTSNLQVLALHGELSLQEQRAALTPASPGTRRIVLATNVAESSVTLPGIRAVIDTGQAREPRFDPNSGFTRLQTVAISQASADQRAGRAGRVAAGRAYRLWPQSQRLEPSRTPELDQVELSGLALELAAWGAETLPWLDAPPPGHLAQARELLVLLGALDRDRRITALGRDLIALGATPRLAAAAARAPAGDRALVADLLAALDARSPLRGDAGRSDDFRLRIAALHAWRRDGARGARDADIGALAALDQASAGWRRRLRSDAPARDGGDALRIGDLLLHAFPDRVARQDPANPRRYALSNGRGARLHDNTALYGEPWLIALDLRLDDKDSLILSAAPFDPDLLERDFPERFASVRAVRWNSAKRAVEAFEERRFAALVLSRRQVAVTPADAVPALMAAVRDSGLDVLPWSDHARELRQRVLALRQWCPELGLPDLSDAALLASLEDWLAPYLDGKSRIDALRADELSQALAGMLDYEQRRALDAQAPVSIRVPSGSERRIEYADGQPPVLAVKLQELFGLADTPRIAQGRVPLTLHLLSPAQRPIQVTQDLKGFWERTYPEVRKELKGRYPRHPWPDDPWSAMPTARAKPRGT
ncbi:MAG: ATP-dependent helicase HrpB [Lysobacterales bacterium 69-70]|nr:ATP-dependent helicase HrpB [Xanthomonadaceae bacterium]ODU31082.1 MAG: ATP-dependent helicase HrpB [Xanthomonadaceae bacterium SCN 69-320]ODV20755.1 MAG: ATP-dependent helicase HrpB [Xanthomonadaceae bacterium SCN 69-25]OJY98670.1 MAG: ATP-dependent helicase HrpB [Xanthomonadales bacterium 69-70]